MRGKAQAFRANLENVAEIEQMIAGVLDAFGRIDILVNSASVFARKPMRQITERDWDATLDTNLKAPFFLSKFAGAAMRRSGAGKIVNLGDWAATRPYKDYLPYSVSKSGLIGLTRALAKELAPEVQVNCIALGMVMPPEEYSKTRSRAAGESHADQKNGLAGRRRPRGDLLLRGHRLRHRRDTWRSTAAACSSKNRPLAAYVCLSLTGTCHRHAAALPARVRVENS